MVELIRVPDLDALVTAAASKFVDTVVTVQATGGIHGDGVARVVLTGGTAGIKVLEQLAEFDRIARVQAEDFPVVHIDWSRVHVFFGDERAVDVADPESNEGQARRALLSHVSIREDYIHSYRLGALSLEESAQWYTSEINTWAPRGFDLHLLGMGHEGHINSLFPHTAEVQEESALVLPVYDSPKPPAQRVTLTLPAVAKAQSVWLLVSGAEKAQAATHIIEGSPAVDWPAAGAHGARNTTLFLTDDAYS